MSWKGRRWRVVVVDEAIVLGVTMESVEDGVIGAGDQELKANAWGGHLCGPGHQEGRQESLQRATRHSSVMIVDRASGSLPLIM